jgi:cytochrome c-type biogenesis protein CcmH
MIFWLIAIAVTAVACAALFYAAAGRQVNAAGPDLASANNHFRSLLAGIDADLANGKLGEDQALAARAELAREVIRSKKEQKAENGRLGQAPLLGGIAAVAAISLALYAVLGSPDMPAQPLAERIELANQDFELDDAIAQIEAQLAQNPDDVRGWTVIAPAYVQMGRYDDAIDAYRRVLALSGASAELETDLAEALLLAAGENGSEEAVDLLRTAVERDPEHIRARLYLAAEMMRLERYDEAETLWTETIALAVGEEGWLPSARQGLLVAQNDGVDPNAAAEQEMISGMVASLAERLAREGGTIEDWTRLVRSYIVLGELELAQSAFDDAVQAYPLTFDRGGLDALALGAGLTIDGDRP